MKSFREMSLQVEVFGWSRAEKFQKQQAMRPELTAQERVYYSQMKQFIYTVQYLQADYVDAFSDIANGVESTRGAFNQPQQAFDRFVDIVVSVGKRCLALWEETIKSGSRGQAQPEKIKPQRPSYFGPPIVIREPSDAALSFAMNRLQAVLFGTGANAGIAGTPSYISPQAAAGDDVDSFIDDINMIMSVLHGDSHDEVRKLAASVQEAWRRFTEAWGVFVKEFDRTGVSRIQPRKPWKPQPRPRLQTGVVPTEDPSHITPEKTVITPRQSAFANKRQTGIDPERTFIGGRPH